MRELEVTVLNLETDKKISEDASKLRGYIGNRFEDHPLLHHHMGEEGLLYTYPRVQYKVIEGSPMLMGIEDGGSILLKIGGEIEELQLGENTYSVEGINLTRKKMKFGGCRKNVQYRFITPWLGLNPSNYRKFKELDSWKKRKELLNGIIVGNILSMSKGFDYIVKKRLFAHSHLDMEKTLYKGIPHIGFKGDFIVNFQIPDLMGLGMGVSQGYGSVIER